MSQDQDAKDELNSQASCSESQTLLDNIRAYRKSVLRLTKVCISLSREILNQYNTSPTFRVCLTDETHQLLKEYKQCLRGVSSLKRSIKP